MTVALYAIAPAHSTSKFASSMSFDCIPGLVVTYTICRRLGSVGNCGQFVQLLELLRKAAQSLRLMSLWPTMAIFCPVPVRPCRYRRLRS